MEETDNHLLCILCCYSFPKSPPEEKEATRNSEALTKFIQQVGVIDKKCLSSAGLLDLGPVSICSECLSGVDKAVEKREQVEEMEGKVRKVQEEILRLMKQLRGLMDGYLEEMRRLEDKIKGGDEDCLRSRFGSKVTKMKRGRPRKEERTWTKENVLQFRRGIINVVQELGQFGQELSSKLCSTPCKSSSNSSKEILNQLEIEQIDGNDDNDDVTPAVWEDDTVDNGDSDTSAGKEPTSAKISRRSSRMCVTDNLNRGYLDDDEDEEDNADKHRDSNFEPDNLYDDEEEEESSSYPPGYLPQSQRTRPSWCVTTRFKAEGKTRQSVSKFHCSTCPSVHFDNHYRLEQHLLAHERDIPSASKTLQCPHCLHQCGLPQLHQLHVLYHQGLWQPYCDQCRRPKLAFSLSSHLTKKHQVQKPIPCSCCSMISSSRENYINHLFLYHRNPNEEAVMACDLCTETFDQRKRLLDHYKTSHEIILSDSLYLSWREKHSNKNRKPGPPRNLVCPECGKVFTHGNTLKKHIACIHSNNRPFQCDECPSAFKTRQHLTEHSKIHQRGKDAPREFQCHLCTKGYYKKSMLDRHLKLHEGKGHSCEECAKLFGTPSELKHHLKYHENKKEVKWWECTQWDSKYKEREQLERHQKVHEKNGRENRCEYCNKVFGKLTYLNMHIKSVHLKQKTVNCRFCEKSFGMGATLRNHMRKMHAEEYNAVKKKRKNQDKVESKTSSEGSTLGQIENPFLKMIFTPND